MKAMVLAAGLGTRLRPLTNTRPKALVEIDGRTLLEITLTRLRSFGINDVIINVHHFADMVIDYLKVHDDFGMRLEISREDDLLLDTGGGLKKASWFFTGDEPFILHNVDVVSTIDLARMIQFHNERQALATLAVKSRKTSRYLYFDNSLQLCGRGPTPDPSMSSHGFSGIHVILPRLLPLLTEAGAFSIIPSYLRMAEAGERILGFSTDEYYWMDLGKPENIQQAERDLSAGLWRS